MTQEQFWEKIQQHLDIPFDIEDVLNIEADPIGALYFDLKNGDTYSLSFQDTEKLWDDDYEDS